MNLAYRGDHTINSFFGADRFESPLVNFLAASLLADRRMGLVRAEERSQAGLAKTALAVLPDVAGSGGKESVAHAPQGGGGNEDDDLALPGPRQFAQRNDVFQTELAGEEIVDAADAVIES